MGHDHGRALVAYAVGRRAHPGNPSDRLSARKGTPAQTSRDRPTGVPGPKNHCAAFPRPCPDQTNFESPSHGRARTKKTSRGPPTAAPGPNELREPFPPPCLGEKNFARSSHCGARTKKSSCGASGSRKRLKIRHLMPSRGAGSGINCLTEMRHLNRTPKGLSHPNLGFRFAASPQPQAAVMERAFGAENSLAGA